MRRYKYGMNCQYHQVSRIGFITPLGMHEVVPGDSVEGSIDFEYFSDVTKYPVLNRAFIDLYMFYVPYRIIDSTFTDILSGSGSAPTAAAAFDFAYQTTSGAQTLPYIGYAYNQIYNDFFRQSEDAEALLTATVPQVASRRASRFTNVRMKVHQRMSL